FGIKGVAHSVETALTLLNRESFDIALVDIDLNGSRSGIEIGTMLHNLYRLPFIFITGISDKTIIAEAVKAKPAAYLQKPASPATLFACIQTAIQNFNEQKEAAYKQHNEADFFFIKTRNKLKRIEWKEVVVLCSSDNYTILTLTDKIEYYLRSSLAMTLKFQIPAHLQSNFMQVNRAEAVQLSFVTEVIEEEIITSVKKIIISPSFIKEVKQRLKILG
ncbi:MAG: response regulator, partial [Bacteroidota bacterium]|nr:response regulator [Bacteroidota bacterium]